jgi:fatty acid desaturase
MSHIPPKPDTDRKPRTSLLPIALVAVVGLVLAAILTVLTLGYFGPIMLIGLIVFAVIGLQYLLWGWWFERAYRNVPIEADEDD